MMTAEETLKAWEQKKADEQGYMFKDFCRQYGFGFNGCVYIPSRPLNDEQKARLRQRGACRYNEYIGWYSFKPMPYVDCECVDAHLLAEWGFDHRWHINKNAARTLVASLRGKHLTEDEAQSEHYGEVGSRYTVQAKFTGHYTIPSDNDFGDLQVWDFADKELHRFRWGQRVYHPDTLVAFMKHLHCRTVSLTFTVKKHDTKDGVKFTRITHCDITGPSGYPTLHDFAVNLREKRRAQMEQDGMIEEGEAND